MAPIPQDLAEQLKERRQEHVLRDWDRLEEQERLQLVQQIRAIDWEQLAALRRQGETTYTLPSLDSLRPPEAETPREEDLPLAEESLRRGEMAALLVAGGQGSRLQFPHPKGMYPIGPVSRKSLFQHHAEKVLALGNRYGVVPPLLIMTSEATDQETRDYFREHRYFGLPEERVRFFSQASMPALSFEDKLLMTERGKLFTSPNGHGGVLQALHQESLHETLADWGVKHVFYFQVDNPMVKVGDPHFLGAHLRSDSEVSLKVIAKRFPKDKQGNVIIQDDRCTMIEYSDLPDEWAELREADGRLRFWAGSIAIHLFSLEFLARMTRSHDSLPYHIAKKAVPHLNERGELVEPEEPNALKFERFIFDVLPEAERWMVMETTPEEEFEPLKNKEGECSPASVRAALCAQAVRWLREAGAEVREGMEVEISPLFASDVEELRERIKPGQVFSEGAYLSPKTSKEINF